MATIPQPIPFPLIQGVRTDHTSLDVRFDGTSGIGQSLWKYGLKSISWDHALEPGEIRGATPQVVALTRGQLKSNGSLELWKADGDMLEAALYQHYQVALLEIIWLIQLTYRQESSIPPSSASLWVRMTKLSESSTNSNEGHANKYELYVLAGVKNGIPLVTGMVVPGVTF